MAAKTRQTTASGHMDRIKADQSDRINNLFRFFDRSHTFPGMDELFLGGAQVDITEGDIERDLVPGLLQETKVLDPDSHFLSWEFCRIVLFPRGMVGHPEAVYLAVAGRVGFGVAIEFLLRIVDFEDDVVEVDGLVAGEPLVAALADGNLDEKVWEGLV